MRTPQFEKLRPGEIVAERERKSIVYLAVGPLEWHGPHLPFGTDPSAAYALALRLAERTGGVVMPPLYCGTEREREAEVLAAFDLDNPDQYVVGMDIPSVTVPSLYFREDSFGIILREHLRLLVNLKYKLIVMVNGHGAANQIATVKRLAVEFSAESPSEVMDIFDLLPMEETGEDPGHATRLETAIQLYLNPDNVDVSVFPARDVPLKYKDYSIADDPVFHLKPSRDFSVTYDPRDADAKAGEKYLNLVTDKLCAKIEARYRAIS